MDYRKAGVMAMLVVLALGVPAWGSSTSTGSISLTFTGVSPTRYATVTGLSGTYYVGTFNFLVNSSPAPTGDGETIATLYGSTGVKAYCIDIRQTIGYGSYSFDIYGLQYAPIGGGNSPMGSTKAADLDKLFTNYEPGVRTALNADTAAAFAASIWEIVNETPGTSYGLGTGTFTVIPSGSSTGWASTADTWLSSLGTGGAYPSALVSTVTQDFAMIIPGVGGAQPIPEPLTMLSAFLAIGSLGLYIRRRTRLG